MSCDTGSGNDRPSSSAQRMRLICGSTPPWHVELFNGRRRDDCGFASLDHLVALLADQTRGPAASEGDLGMTGDEHRNLPCSSLWPCMSRSWAGGYRLQRRTRRWGVQAGSRRSKDDPVGERG